MNTLTILTIILVIGYLVYTGLRLFFSIFMNFQQGIQLRESLGARLNYLPLANLLKKIGIDKNHYVQQKSLHVIDEQIRNCENCSHKSSCISNLNSRDGKIEKILAFCPNKLNFFEYKYAINNNDSIYE